MFARLIYIGVTLLHRKDEEVWHMIYGELLDQWEIYRQMNGMAKPIVKATIDEVFPPWLT